MIPISAAKLDRIHNMPVREKAVALQKYISNRIHHRPMLASIEMTKFCNARCDFCDDWKTKNSPKLGDVVDMVRKLNPIVLAITGGEPLLEKHLPQIIRDVKADQKFIYIYMITNGSLLTEERAEELYAAGLNQISVSMNYLDARLDEERVLPGLSAHVSTLIPKLASRGRTIVANTVILRENLDQILPIARQTYDWHTTVSYSCYTDFKNGNRSHYFVDGRLEELRGVVDGLIAHKKRYGNIANSRYYLERIVEYYTSGGIPGCKAGNAFVQLTPDGQVRQCSDFAPFVHYKEYRGMPATDCKRCWYSCRGESESSLSVERVAELLRRI